MESRSTIQVLPVLTQFFSAVRYFASEFSSTAFEVVRWSGDVWVFVPSMHLLAMKDHESRKQDKILQN